jgi:phage tail-like protein
MTAQDPYESFRFRIRWDGAYVAGVSAAAGLNRSNDAVEHREGGDRAQIPEPACRGGHPPITLERGITLDAAFQSWATNAS